MVRSFNLLRQIGKFENVSTGAALPFTGLTVIYADNARGKTTLAAILRSLGSNRPQLVTERARLGADNQPHIVIDTGGGATAVFENGAWSGATADVAVFDDLFVTENVHSGTEVNAAHRQNLHELIIGHAGIALAGALQTEVDKIEAHNRALREREAAIPAAILGGLTVDAFCALRLTDQLDKQLDEASRRLAAANDGEKVARTATFLDLLLPFIDIEALRNVLAATLADLDSTALARVREHFDRLGEVGETWASLGIVLADRIAAAGGDNCPFCAQDLRESPILGHYRAYFSEAYNALKGQVALAHSELNAIHGGDVLAAFERAVREAVERRDFWKAFAEIPAINVDTAAIARTWKEGRELIKGLLDQKSGAPLDRLDVSAELERVAAEHNRNCETIRNLSNELVQANARLDLVKEEARNANVATLRQDLANLQAIRARHEPQNSPLCDAYLSEKAAKGATERRRDGARASLDRHRETAFPAYGAAINDFLQRFNASFRVGPVDPVNTRAGSSANYTLLIDGNPVPLAANDGEPSFRNTLSAGDRNTLALAFFFANLQSDQSRDRKVVVIDDPMTSLDEHRTLHTLQEIDRLAREVASIVILSHSKPFLVGVWDKCQQIVKTALEVRRDGTGSTLAAWDVSAAMITEHDRRYLTAAAYLHQADPANERRVAESLRPMLEAFCRVAYAVDFPPGTMLGRFHQQCNARLATQSPIMGADDARELRAILDYANTFHHDSNPAHATEIINDGELMDFTRRTLSFISRG
jgi:wobble nucleotide-excising tRNase